MARAPAGHQLHLALVEMSGLDATGEVRQTTALIDGHVHIHECFECERFFDAAAANLQRARDKLHVGGDVYGSSCSPRAPVWIFHLAGEW